MSRCITMEMETMSSYTRTPENDNSEITTCQLYQDVQAFLVAPDMFKGPKGAHSSSEGESCLL